VAFLDLDRFKTINDTAVGDELLQLAAQRLVDCLREGDTTPAGEEMNSLFYYLKLPVQRMLGLAQIILTSFKTPFVNDHELHITTSIGIALAPMTVKTLKLC